MGKYIGPKSKIARKFGEAIYGADKVLEKRNFPPGQHGLARKRKKVSEYGPTRAAARQLVSHCHICVNGSVVNIPSYSLRAGDVVSVREKSKSLEVITASLAGSSKSRYAWLEWDNASMSGKFLQKPEREEIPENIKEQLIVELYSK